MDVFEFFAILVTLVAVVSYTNSRFFRLPPPIFLLLVGVALSAGLFVADVFVPASAKEARAWLVAIDFNEFLFGGILSFLLFAGSMRVSLRSLKSTWKSVAIFSTVGVVISIALLSTLLYLMLAWAGLPVGFSYCLVFGALMSPTDPVAIMGLLKRTGIPEGVQVTIIGESLFNDGVGVVAFVALLGVVSAGGAASWQSGAIDGAVLFVREGLGGLGVGAALGYTGFILMRSIDDLLSELLITLAMVMGGVLLCHALHVSAPLAMVVAGMITGNVSSAAAMSDKTRDYLEKFWEVVDEVLNALLFMLLGLQLATIPFELATIVIGIATAVLLIPVRYVSLWLPTVAFRLQRELPEHALSLLTWGGMRGGISIALALSLPRESGYSSFVPIAFVVVLLSISLQSVMLKKLAMSHAASEPLPGASESHKQIGSR